MNSKGKLKYVYAIAELPTMRMISSRQVERAAFFYHPDDLPDHVRSDKNLLEEWEEILNQDGIIIHDQVHGVH